MSAERKSYPDDHWLKNSDPVKVLESYMDQQSKAYSKTKNAFIRELAGDLRGKRVLDYGCGAGLFTAYAARQGAKAVVGVDAEETALAAARLLVDQEGVSSACTFVRSDRFPRFAETTRFDLVLLKDVIEHVDDDESLIAAAAAALIPGGRLVLSTQNALSLNYIIEGSYNRLWLGRRDWMGWDSTHVRFYTPMNLSRKLRRAGLRQFFLEVGLSDSVQASRPARIGQTILEIGRIGISRSTVGIYLPVQPTWMEYSGASPCFSFGSQPGKSGTTGSG